MNKSETYQYLRNRNISFEAIEHPAVFNMEELYAQGLEHGEAIAKNLLVRDQKKRFYWLLVLYGEKRADLKALKARLGHGALSFAGAEELKALLHLTPGSVTPFGALNDAEHRVDILLDEDYRGQLIGVHPNDNTATVWLPADALAELLRQQGAAVEFISF